MPNNKNLPPLPPGYELDSPSDTPEPPEGYKVDGATRMIKFRGNDNRIYQVPHHNLEKVRKIHKGMKVLPN